jgi:methylenetetrahydrofolate reductase (NADPH)
VPEVATYSFELYPPRNAAAELALYESLGALVAAQPEFISVTYGASGSTRDSSLGVLRHLLTTSVSPMAHLTCVGWTYAEASKVIREFLDAGLTSFLALRGDPPAGSLEGDDFLGDLKSAGELVQLVHRVQAERVPFLEESVPGFPGARKLSSGKKVTIAVAAFPNGHPRSRSVEQDLDTLLAKEAAGANLAITQLFFDAEDYLRFVDQARAAGVTMRILPGLMPILSPERLERMIALTGERMPVGLLERLRRAETPAAQHAVGIEHATTLSQALLDGGAPGLHLYTFNRHDAVIAVLDGVGLLPAHTPRQPAPLQSETIQEHA